ncbi:hypothetical protein [Sphingomonas sp.]|uniref:hypothetical protein n=1 Tax=Sphingomonas sp. TaxID=28214 RepID=UPI002BA8C820|nr:hypothetical protein [Sphingomonas sp.]HWK36374.1 hypothetical protein [Sphingomonas sp.]
MDGTLTPADAASGQMHWLTTTNIVVIAIAVIVAVVAIWWGLRAAARRNAGDGAIAAPPVSAPAPVPVPPIAEPLAPIVAEPVAPPVAPPPPPLADTPVVAAAPFEAAPATIAAELAAPPPPAAAPASTNDDFTRMKGVGPKLAARLKELGVTRYQQIAELTPADADALDAQLGAFKGRMTRDRWIEQAGYLARNDRAGFEAAFGKL